MVEVEEVRPSYIANCVVNAFLSIVAIFLNAVTIHAIRKTSSLAKPLRTLLLSLAVSDLGVGLLVQPLYVTRLVVQTESNNENASPLYKVTSIAFLIPANLFAFASFFGVTALSADRFLAIHLHLRYRELVTHKRVVAVVISSWVCSVSLSLIRFLGLRKNERFVFYSAIDIVCLVATAILYCKLYLVVKRHRNQILQAQQMPQNAELTANWANAANQKKSAVGTFYVYLVLIACYLPQVCNYVITFTTGSKISNLVLSRYAFTLVFLNSSLNPLIYCWKMRHIRHNILNLMRKILRIKV